MEYPPSSEQDVGEEVVAMERRIWTPLKRVCCPATRVHSRGTVRSSLSTEVSLKVS